MSFINNDEDLKSYTTNGIPLLERDVASFLSKTYGWMALAMVITALAAWLVGNNVAYQEMLFTGYRPLVLVGVEVALVLGLSFALNRISAATASLLFVAYSLVNGLTLGVIFLVYTQASIFSTFIVCAILFGVMSLYGYFTKKDLSSIGRLLFFALIGIIIASVVNMFLGNSMLDLVISAIGVIVFIGLTAYDTQKIKGYAQDAIGNDESSYRKLTIISALCLYLDFVNLFLYLLKFLGNRR